MNWDIAVRRSSFFFFSDYCDLILRFSLLIFLYQTRIGDFIDVSEGPLIPRTSVCFQYEVSAVHSLHGSQPNLIRRFQGLSLPTHLRVRKSEAPSLLGWGCVEPRLDFINLEGRTFSFSLCSTNNFASLFMICNTLV